MDKSELKQRLGDLAFEVTQQQATEAPYSGKLLNEFSAGEYHCVVCGELLFESSTKFDSHCGWPSFDAVVKGAVLETEDLSHGMRRTEISCSACKAHLGHVFDDGPTETGTRYCINSVSLNFIAED
jgi:peptide-methionine (R)-S-oxide reductase